MKSKFSHILFDLGNVIFKINFDHCFRLWSIRAGISFEEMKGRFRFDEAYDQHERGELSGQEYHAHLCKILKYDFTFQEFLEGWNAIYGPPIEETLFFLKKSQGKIKLYAFTNSNKIHREFWSKKYTAVLKNFTKVFCSSQLGCRKPEPQAFRSILTALNIQPEQLIFIDDLLENIRGAESVGIKSVHFNNPKSAMDELRRLTFQI